MSESAEKIIENMAWSYEHTNSSVNHFKVFWEGLGVEVVHRLREAGYVISKSEPYAAIDSDQTAYSFAEWIRLGLVPVDQGVTIHEVANSRLEIKLNGDWHIATVYRPDPGLLGVWLDQYPRELQAEVFRRLIFGINAWCGFATDIATGVVVER